MVLVAVLPEHQGKGVGKALVEWGTNWADKYDPPLVVALQAHKGSTRLYEKTGFVTAIESEMEDTESESGKIHWLGMKRAVKA